MGVLTAKKKKTQLDSISNIFPDRFVRFENSDLEKLGVCLSKLISLENLTLNLDV